MQVQKSNLSKFKAKIFKALSDPIRLEIIDFLRNGEKCVCEITPHLNLIQPLVSRHLKILKDSGLVAYRKDGNKRLYSIPNQKILEVVDSLTPSIIDFLSKRIIEQIVAK